MTDNKAPRPGHEATERANDQFLVRVRVARGQADELLRRGEFDFGDHPNITPNPDGTAQLTLFVSQAQVETLRGEGYEIEVGANLSARARERLAEVGQGDRFEGGKVPPRGLGRKLGGRSRPSRQGGPTDARPDDRPERAS
jgi:hypothetical protein